MSSVQNIQNENKNKKIKRTNTVNACQLQLMAIFLLLLSSASPYQSCPSEDFGISWSWPAVSVAQKNDGHGSNHAGDADHHDNNLPAWQLARNMGIYDISNDKKDLWWNRTHVPTSCACTARILGLVWWLTNLCPIYCSLAMPHYVWC